MSERGLLVLADGTVFGGSSVGADGVASGEVVFTTSMTGYQEVVTDPSYAGQIVTMTAPHIGNYGVAGVDDQSAGPACAGFVVRSMSRRDSSWRSEGSFGAWLRERGVVALSDVDTRRLTRHIRSHGAMPAAIGSGVGEAELVEVAASAPSMAGRDLASGVATREPYEVAAAGASVGHVVAVDLGIKRDILRRLSERGLDVTVVPPGTSAADIVAMRPDGVFVSNGPGDPEPLVGPTETVRGLVGEVPVFGICLGHQVLGLALGARTFKLPFGHHGGNHPVRRMSDGVVEITSQNHGFAVDLWSLAGGEPPQRVGVPGAELLPERVETAFGPVVPTHQNLNDGTLEGLRCVDVAAFSVQYHPEAAPGPNDADHLFDRFAGLIGGGG
ncbi:MAG: glutamine-hydrolyzing carbamoyl-phosphate synthase small subunit [Acidimicrobiia bacterium]|nr:glutamine-hydrolyzing carbamoyl-phosphate synthase small subunit [Acidimicrobiia bacterium]